MKFKLGAKVRQIVKPVEGQVEDVLLDKTNGEVSYLIVTTDGEGTEQKRWMPESQLEKAK